MMKIATVEEQRQKQSASIRGSVALWCTLKILIEDILKGGDDVQQKLVDFQQLVQFAPREMKEQFLAML